MKRRILDIAATNQDPTGQVTRPVLDRWARLEPREVPVFSTMEARLIGHCIRFWRENNELWAEMEVDDRALWPSPAELLLLIAAKPMHCEAIFAVRKGRPELRAVLFTDLPRGVAGRMFAAHGLSG